jgi:hypothetical protein
VTNQSADRNIQGGRVRAFGDIPLPDEPIFQSLKRLQIFSVLGVVVDFGPDARCFVIFQIDFRTNCSRL